MRSLGKSSWKTVGEGVRKLNEERALQGRKDRKYKDPEDRAT